MQFWMQEKTNHSCVSDCMCISELMKINAKQSHKTINI